MPCHFPCSLGHLNLNHFQFILCLFRVVEVLWLIWQCYVYLATGTSCSVRASIHHWRHFTRIRKLCFPQEGTVWSRSAPLAPWWTAACIQRWRWEHVVLWIGKIWHSSPTCFYLTGSVYVVHCFWKDCSRLRFVSLLQCLLQNQEISLFSKFFVCCFAEMLEHS